MQQAGSSTWSTRYLFQHELILQVFLLWVHPPREASNIGFDNLEITGAATQGALGPGTFTDGTVINDGKNIAVITYDLHRPDVALLM